MRNMRAPIRAKQETAPSDYLKATRIVGQDWYREYYATKGADRNSLLSNPEVLFQNLAQEAALVRAVQSLRPNEHDARILDVGCGDGSSLITFLRLGFSPGNLYGVDLQESRIRQGKQRLPGVNFQSGDATRLEYSSEAFDLVFESTMFIHCVDRKMSQQIADEMLRVTKSGGNVILGDWRYSKPGSDAHKALSQHRIAELFRVGSETMRCGVFRGPLVPPVGRFFSRRLPALYFLVQGLCPFLVGQIITVLRKI
jgi:SAM-dependent methyltransferase